MTDNVLETAPELTVAPPTDAADVQLFRGYSLSGQVSFSPIDPKRLAVGIGALGGSSRCLIKTSADSGKTWSTVQLPQPQPQPGAETLSYCFGSAPAVTYTSDGRRLYAAYAYSNLDLYRTGVVVSASTDYGRTWSRPIAALPEYETDNGEYYNLHLSAALDSPVMYLAALIPGHFGNGLLVANSRKPGASWDYRAIDAGSSIDATSLGTFSLAAGRNGDVFVAYDWEQPIANSDYIDYLVQVAKSSDYGASFFSDTVDEFIRPNYDSSGIDIKVAPLGTAHLVYGKGDKAILYKYSLPPYGNWFTAPVRLDSKVAGSTVWSPRIAVGACGQASVLHVTWLEKVNQTRRVVYTRRVAKNGYVWSSPMKVGGANNAVSINHLAGAGAKAFSTWETFPSSPDDWTIFGSGITSGIGCP